MLQIHVVESITGMKYINLLHLDTEQQNTSYQQIDHSKLVPLLTKSLQEALTRIETLEAKVTALEGDKSK